MGLLLTGQLGPSLKITSLHHSHTLMPKEDFGFLLSAVSRAHIAWHTFFSACAWIEYSNRKVLAVVVCMRDACLSRLTVWSFPQRLPPQMCARRNSTWKIKINTRCDREEILQLAEWFLMLSNWLIKINRLHVYIICVWHVNLYV